MTDYLVCTECGQDTNCDVDSLYDSMSRTKAGKRRRGQRWAKILNDLVANWKCDTCLDYLEAKDAEAGL